MSDLEGDKILQRLITKGQKNRLTKVHLIEKELFMDSQFTSLIQLFYHWRLLED